LDKCLNIFSLNYNDSLPIVKKFIGDMHDVIAPKDKNYEKMAKNAKDLSTLTGVANDLIIDPALLMLKAFLPSAGIAASLIKGAIFYGISITKTASCGYSFISRNFHSEEYKITYEERAKKVITGLTCKSILCSIDNFNLLGGKEISILRDSINITELLIEAKTILLSDYIINIIWINLKKNERNISSL
jgi:hypothetical protein